MHGDQVYMGYMCEIFFEVSKVHKTIFVDNWFMDYPFISLHYSNQPICNGKHWQ